MTSNQSGWEDDWNETPTNNQSTWNNAPSSNNQSSWNQSSNYQSSDSYDSRPNRGKIYDLLFITSLQ